MHEEKTLSGEILQSFLLGHIQYENKDKSSPLSDLNLSSFDFGSSQHLNELLIVHGVALSGTEPEQDLILNFFQLLFHFGIADDQLVLGLFEVWAFLSYHLAQQLVL